MQIAIQNVGALGADFDDALLLAFGASEKVGVTHELQVREPRGGGGSPEAEQRGYDQQTDLRAAEIHSRTRDLHPFKSTLKAILLRIGSLGANLLGPRRT